MCLKRNINAIIINDHDVYGLTNEEEENFFINGIAIQRAIEFTTKEGVHIIGIHPQIKSLQKASHYYTVYDIIETLLTFNAFIIIPHPNHQTGLLGNGKVETEDIEYVLSNSHFLEIDNYKYGSLKKRLLINKYSNLKYLIGSDAHSANNIGAYLNIFFSSDRVENLIEYMYKSEITHLYRMKHTWIYWEIKKIKKTFFYQFLLNLFSSSLRRKVKNKLFNK
jgi:hypothetical protein